MRGRKFERPAGMDQKKAALGSSSATKHGKGSTSAPSMSCCMPMAFGDCMTKGTPVVAPQHTLRKLRQPGGHVVEESHIEASATFSITLEMKQQDHASPYHKIVKDVQQHTQRELQQPAAQIFEQAQTQIEPGPRRIESENATSPCHQIVQEVSSKVVQLPEEEDGDDDLTHQILPEVSLEVAQCPEDDDDLGLLICQAKANGWFIEPHEIVFKEKVAEGSTATVHKATWRGLEVAVKCINSDYFNSNENGLSFFIQELLTLSMQRHPFVLQLMGACLSPPDHGWVVTEYLKMTLTEWLHGPGGRKKEKSIEQPPLRDRVIKALEISQAMQYLHQRKPMLVHRDLKPSNIFLDDSGHVRVADFGHATLLGDGEKALTGETGTYVYMAPEVFLSKPYDDKSDVFSFGVVLNELVTGDYPYIDKDLGPYQIAAGVADGVLRPTLPQDSTSQLGDLVNLIRQCWDSNESNRPSSGTITCALKNILKNLVSSLD